MTGHWRQCDVIESEARLMAGLLNHLPSTPDTPFSVTGRSRVPLLPGVRNENLQNLSPKQATPGGGCDNRAASKFFGHIKLTRESVRPLTGGARFNSADVRMPVTLAGGKLLDGAAEVGFESRNGLIPGIREGSESSQQASWARTQKRQCQTARGVGAGPTSGVYQRAGVARFGTGSSRSTAPVVAMGCSGGFGRYAGRLNERAQPTRAISVGGARRGISRSASSGTQRVVCPSSIHARA